MEDTMAFMEEDMGVSYLGVKAYTGNPTTRTWFCSTVSYTTNA